MAGIWERIKSDATDRVIVNLLEVAVVLHATNAFANSRILEMINNTVTTPIDSVAEADLVAIGVAVDAQSPTVNKIVYLEKVRAWTLLAELGETTEVEFRAALGI